MQIFKEFVPFIKGFLNLSVLLAKFFEEKIDLSIFILPSRFSMSVFAKAHLLIVWLSGLIL